MAQADTVIFITLSLIILFLLHLLLQKKRVEGFENDVPEERLIELNYLKKMLGLKEAFPKCPDEDNNRCASNNREKWCMNSSKDK